MKKLTALFDGLIGHVPAVCMFVAHFLHADTLPTATLEHGRAFTRIFYGEEHESMNFNFNRNGMRLLCIDQSKKLLASL